MADSILVSDSSAELSRYAGKKGRRLAIGLIESGGLTDLVTSFESALSDVRKRPDTTVVVDAFGQLLWRHAVEFAQGGRQDRSLPANDDRPLYWARLAMRQVLMDWRPRFRINAEELTGWNQRLEWASRGITTTGFGDGDAVKVLISGFDPFRLHHNPMATNPSGAVALRLHDQTIETDHGPVRFAAVILPVRYADFDAGLVEKVFRPHLQPGPQQVRVAATISQGRRSRFDLEVYNGRRRFSGTTRDNDGVSGGTTDLEPAEPAGLAAGPEFTVSNLPIEEMLAAGDRPYPVGRNRQISQLLPGAAEVGVTTEGPEADAISVKGGGGGFLSNEVAYRVTRLRDELNVSVRCGHIHTPSLDMEAGTTSDPDILATEREQIIDQTRRLLLSAAAASPAGDPITH